METTTVTCDCCKDKIDAGAEASLSASLTSIENPVEARDIELDDLCVLCSDAFLTAISEIIIRRQPK